MRIDTEQLEISVDQLRAMLDRGEPVTVLDIRREAERAEWSIPGSLHLDVYDRVGQNDPTALADFKPPVGKPVVAVCNRGNTSLLAAARLRARGFPALSMQGGMRAWTLAWNVAAVALPGLEGEVLQVRRTGKGCLSYLVGSRGSAAVIDPAVDVRVFTDLAAARSWTITHVLETHIHADHVSRAKALADTVGARLFLSRQDRVRYPFTALEEGSTLMVGGVTVTALHTPGHTFESTCYRLADRALCTGDTLFLSAVGRPDLASTADAETRRRAALLFQSLSRLRTLPPDLIVLPGHTGEPVPFDGRALAAPLGDVLARVEMLPLGEGRFVEAILEAIPDPPENHLGIVQLNEAGELPRDTRDLEAGANRCAVGGVKGSWT